MYYLVFMTNLKKTVKQLNVYEIEYWKDVVAHKININDPSDRILTLTHYSIAKMANILK